MKIDKNIVKKLGLIKPTVLIDAQKAKTNILNMQQKAHKNGVRFRPHFKTHQSEKIAGWFRSAGVESVAVSSLSMAAYFAAKGWKDITVAILVNTNEMDTINMLAADIELTLLVDNQAALQVLKKRLTHSVNVMIKVDTGYGRSGLGWQDTRAITGLVKVIKNSKIMNFRGLLTHAGQDYLAASKSEILNIYRETVKRISTIRQILVDEGIENCLLSIGDTPCCSALEELDGVDEIRPGNFIFYDMMQYQIGSCSQDQIAAAVACPVVGKYADENRIVIYGGAVHFSKEYLLTAGGEKAFAYLAEYEDDTWKLSEGKIFIHSLSQEHGKLYVPDKLFSSIDVGDFLLFFPVHSCLTCNLHSDYITLEGERLPHFHSTF